MFGFSTAKLIGMGLGLLAILSFVVMAFHWKGQAADRKHSLEVICQATRDASNQPKLGCGQVPDQIKFMGEAVTALSNSLRIQNAAVQSLGDETKRQQAEAAQASRIAQGRAQKAEATSERLKASSRAGDSQNAPDGQFSKTFEETWR